MSLIANITNLFAVPLTKTSKRTLFRKLATVMPVVIHESSEKYVRKCIINWTWTKSQILKKHFTNLLATKSTDLLEGPQKSTWCRPTLSLILLIFVKRQINLIAVCVFPVPEIKKNWNDYKCSNKDFYPIFILYISDDENTRKAFWVSYKEVLIDDKISLKC